MKKLILCLVGESGSGKTTIAEFIRKKYGIKMIESYTERPKRNENEIGHTFITSKEFDAINETDMVAYTVFNENRYCCLHEDLEDINTYVISEDGLEMLNDNYAHMYDIVSLRLMRDKDKRIEVVGQERVDRDEGHFFLDEDYFDHVLDVDINGLEELKVLVINAVRSILIKRNNEQIK